MMNKSDRILAQLLAECVDLLLQGESPAACLARYPEHATSLAPLLYAVAGVRELGTVPPRPAHVAASSRARFVAAAAQARRPAALRQKQPGPVALRQTQPAPAAWPGRLQAAFAALRPIPGGLLAMLLLVLVVGILATGVVTTSANALPGDTFYNVKLVREQAQLLLTIDAASREALDQQIQNERVTEATTIQQMGRAVDNMPLGGIIEAYSDIAWTVSGVAVQVTPETTIVGQPVLGGVVRGQVRAPGDGSLVALYLRVDNPPAPRSPAGYSVVTVTSWPVVTVTPSPTRRPYVYPLVPTAVRPRRALPPGVIVTPAPARTRTPVPAVTVPPATQPPATVAPASTASTSAATPVVVPTVSPGPPSATPTAPAPTAPAATVPVATPTSSAASATPTPPAPANTATTAPPTPTTAPAAATNTPPPPAPTNVPAAATNTPPPPAPTLPAPTNTPVPPANTPAPPVATP